MRPWRHALSLAILVSISASWGASPEVPSSLPGHSVPAVPSIYAIRHWDTDDGLPAHTITDIEQAADGYLWMTTTAGLLRFDGHRFAVFDQRNAGLVNPRLASLRFTEGGGIRVVADDLSVMESPTAVAPRFSPIHTPREMPAPAPSSIMFPSRGEVLLERPNGNRTELLDERSRVRASFAPRPGWKPRLVDRFGNLWLSTHDAIEVRRPEGRVALWSHAFPQGTTIGALTEDAEGDIWIGTVTDGLYRVKPVAFRIYEEDSGIEDTGVTDVSPSDDGGVFILSARGDIYLLENGRARRILGRAKGTFLDRQGTVWTMQWRHLTGGPVAVDLIGAASSGGERGVARLTSVIGLLHLFESPATPNILWARDNVRVYRIEAGEGANPRVEWIDEGNDLRQALVDRSGILWLASSRGITRVIGRERKRYTVKDGLPTERVRSIHEDADGTLWFGTYGGGIVRLKDGRFQSLDQSRGLAEDVVNSILLDRSGNFWMSGNRGIHRTPRAEIEAVLDGRAPRVDSILYGRPGGLANPESSGFTGVADRTGRFWFPTFHGAAVVDPEEALALEDSPVHVLVEDVVSLPRAAHREPRGGYSIASGGQSLEIAYTAATLRDPENVRFQYYLEGYDPEWIEAGTRRSSTYTRLPPGTYRFHVRAFVTPGRWIEAAAAVPIVVMPEFHQKGWFKGLILAAGIFGAVGAYRGRTRYLRRRAVRLEKTVEERTKELAREKETVARQVEQLQELERAKSRFFANVSHEFRTPLTLIQGPLEDLQQGLHGPLNEDVREQIDVATRSSHRLLQLVDELLDIARAESGRLSMRARRGDFRLFLRRVVGALSPLAERKGVALGVEAPETATPLWFDPEHLEKVLLNVIGNALKFTPAGGQVRVVVRVEGNGPESGALVTEVVDDGPGIPEEDLPRIFDRFHRGGGRARSQPGAGIGLALARELVSLHGGTIQAESHLGQGSLFTIRLPLGRSHLADSELAPEDEVDLLHPVAGAASPRLAGGVKVEADSSSSGSGFSQGDAGGDAAEVQVYAPADDDGAGPAPDGARTDSRAEARPEQLALDGDVMTILIADDNEEVRRYVRGHLERRYRVVEARNGREALDIARRMLPDLLVSDVMMPVMDGMALCREIKTDPEMDYLPIVLLTARASTDSRIEGLEEGADDYLGKPFNVRELEARIHNLIASRRRLKEHLAATSASGQEPYTFSITPGLVSVPSPDAAFLEQVRVAIQTHLGEEEFDPEALAREIGASRATLYRRLKELLGQSPMSLIRRVRLEQAAALLAKESGSIGEIAYAVGFRSVAQFSATFKEHHGTTPSAYRRAHRTPPEED